MPSRPRGATLCGIVVFLAAASTANAHHSAAPHFDLEKTIEIKGTVTKFEFVNPHGYVYLNVTGENGRKTPWRCELAARVALARLGWKQETFHPGQKVTIKGSPARREANVCYLSSFTTEDGKEIQREAPITETANGAPSLVTDAASRPARTPAGQPNFQGFWVAATGPGGRGRGRGPGANGAPGGRGGDGRGPGGRGRGGPPGAPELTAEGEAAMKNYDQRFDDPAIKCSPANIIFGWTHDQHVNEITQKADTMVLKFGYMDYVRTIHIGGQHAKSVSPSLGGHSIAKWEGDVLVVDTVGFKTGVLVPLSGMMHSNQMHLEERFTLDPAAGRLTPDIQG